MKPSDFHDMNKNWQAHKFVVNTVRQYGDLHVIDLNIKESRYFGERVSDLGFQWRKKIFNLFRLQFPKLNIKLRYV